MVGKTETRLRQEKWEEKLEEGNYLVEKVLLTWSDNQTDLVTLKP